MKVSLLRLLLLGSLAAACLAVMPTASAQKDLELNVSVVTSEHSRDSNSTTRVLRVSANTLVYEESHHGARANRPTLKKEYLLTAADRDRLIWVLKDKALLRTKFISKSAGQDGPSRDFEVRIAARLAGRQGLVSIKAPRSAAELKTDPIYQGSVLLITEIYRIINRTDPDVTFDQLIK